MTGEAKTERAAGRAWCWAVYFVLALSVLRGIRFPNLWSYSHFLFDYEQGFVKRGLLGAATRALGLSWLRSYEGFVLYAALVFALAAVLFARLLADLAGTGSSALRLAALAAAAGIGTVFLAHTIGYADHVGLLATLALLLVRDPRRRYVLAWPALLLCAAVHEGFVVWFLPVLLFSLVLDRALGRPRAPSYRALAALSGAGLLWALVLAAATLPPERAQALYRAAAAAHGALRQDAFAELAMTPAANADRMARVWSDPDLVLFALECLLVTLPPALFFVWLALRGLRAAGAGRALALAALGAAFAPLALHPFGWDVARWDALAQLDAFLVLATAVRAGAAPPESAGAAALAACLAVYGGASTIGLFDDYRVKNAPFVEHQFYLYDTARGRAPFPARPRR